MQPNQYDAAKVLANLLTSMPAAAASGSGAPADGTPPPIRVIPPSAEAQHVMAWIERNKDVVHVEALSHALFEHFSDEELRALIDYELRITYAVIVQKNMSLMAEDIVDALETLIAQCKEGGLYGRTFIYNHSCGCIIGTSILATTPHVFDLSQSTLSNMSADVADVARKAAGPYCDGSLLGMEILVSTVDSDSVILDSEETEETEQEEQEEQEIVSDGERALRLVISAAQGLLDEVRKEVERHDAEA